ncbi:hypothetical protein [Campylobacter sp. CCUG 57310]|uniref:hypothetical protein n=1 Tax=Campylobacter sp. CCUG 57310 TaxID=2517362 RepID=UPI001563001C|nr:hypothetical protein [Campylobacter sp. CCUG 57310]QKF93224.1 hypothetical protein CORI_a038 [Campylobacter sp. CCUG 57310]
MAQIQMKSDNKEKVEVKANLTKKKSGSNKQLLILLALLIFSFLGLFFLFSNIGDEEQAQATINTEQAQSKQAQAGDINLAPPTLINKEAIGKNNEPKNLLDEEAVKEYIKKAEEYKEKSQIQEEIEKQQTTEEQERLKKEQELAELEAKKQEQKEKNSLDTLKENIKMKNNYFVFQGRNFYEGDKILGFKIGDVTNSSVTLKDKNNEKIILNFIGDKTK